MCNLVRVGESAIAGISVQPDAASSLLVGCTAPQADAILGRDATALSLSKGVMGSCLIEELHVGRRQGEEVRPQGLEPHVERHQKADDG